MAKPDAGTTLPAGLGHFGPARRSKAVADDGKVAPRFTSVGTNAAGSESGCNLHCSIVGGAAFLEK